MEKIKRRRKMESKGREGKEEKEQKQNNKKYQLENQQIMNIING